MSKRQDGIHEFLNEYNNVLGEFLKETFTYPPDDFNAWLTDQRVKPGRRKVAGDIKYYHHIYNNLPSNIKDTYVMSRIYCAKFVYIKNISLRNIILSLFAQTSINIIDSVVKLPIHADLKEFLVPEELINQKNVKRFFELDWINQ